MARIIAIIVFFTFSLSGQTLTDVLNKYGQPDEMWYGNDERHLVYKTHYEDYDFILFSADDNSRLLRECYGFDRCEGIRAMVRYECSGSFRFTRQVTVGGKIYSIYTNINNSYIYYTWQDEESFFLYKSYRNDKDYRDLYLPRKGGYN